MTCLSQGQQKNYLGENHRSAWNRVQDHWKALEVKDNKYAIAKHQEKEHRGQKHNFYFKVKLSFTSSLKRQIREAILIYQGDLEVKLNSKAEWVLNSIPRLIVHQDSIESHPLKAAFSC